MTKSTIYINTWHGSAIKYLGNDVKTEGKSFKGKSASKEKAFYTQSEFDEYVFKRAFGKKDDDFKRFGLPRNDELACVEDDKVMHIKEELGIDKHKKVILYCPTFREFSKSNNGITQKIYHIPNAGVANARNLGLSVATGEYIVFADSDDIYMDEFIEKSLVAIKHADYVSWAFETFNSKKMLGKIDYLSDFDDTISIEDYLQRMIQYQAGAYWGANWGKFYKKSIIDNNNIRFESNVLFAEDFRFNLEYLKYVKNISVMHEKGYLYRVDTEGSLSKKRRNLKQYWNEYYELYSRYIQLYSVHKMDDICREGLNSFLIGAYISVIREAGASNKLSLIDLIKLSFMIEKKSNVKTVAKNIKETNGKNAFFAKLIRLNIGWIIGLFYQFKG